MNLRRLLSIISLICLSGCSVIMAATEREAPDLSQVRIGNNRAQIERDLGRPMTQSRVPGGSIAIYQYIANDKASYQRAAAYVVLDTLTVGTAELITFGAEAVQGDRHEIEIFYDSNDIARAIDARIHKAPIDKPEVELGIVEDESKA